MKRINFKILGLVLFAGLLVAQLFSIDKTLPPVNSQEDFYTDSSIPEDVRTMLKNACKDCHSHETTYPWYTSLQPLAWWLGGHIRHGRENLNFSRWHTYDATRKSRKIDECIEVLEQRRMPYKSYRWFHKEAQLSEDDYNRLIAYFESVK